MKIITGEVLLQKDVETQQAKIKRLEDEVEKQQAKIKQLEDEAKYHGSYRQLCDIAKGLYTLNNPSEYILPGWMYNKIKCKF